MLSENKTVRKNAEYPNNRIDRCSLSDLKSDTYSNSFSPSDIYSEKITNISSDIVLVPGFVDVHVHLREPGFHIKKLSNGNACRRKRRVCCDLHHAEP